MIIKDFLVHKTRILDKSALNTFNLYMPPNPIGGDADKAGPWRQHGEFIWGEYHHHIERWLAHRIQFPEIKINHGLVMGSPKQGIGVDSYIRRWLGRLAGEWNFADVAATRAYEKFANENSFLESVILRINEAHDLGDKRFNFYERTKDWFAAPPETLMIRDLWIKQHPMFNLVGPIVTTNHLTDGLYLPPEDRRCYVAWSECRPEEFTGQYWNELWNWYRERRTRTRRTIFGDIGRRATSTPRLRRPGLQRGKPSSTPIWLPRAANWPISLTPWATTSEILAENWNDLKQSRQRNLRSRVGVDGLRVAQMA